MVPWVMLMQLLAATGVAICAYAVYAEYADWPSRKRYCVATKVPIEIFDNCGGPFTLWSVGLYFGLFGFVSYGKEHYLIYPCLPFTIIFLDMMVTTTVHRGDLCPICVSLAAIDIVLSVYSFFTVAAMPYFFLLFLGICWGCVLTARWISSDPSRAAHRFDVDDDTWPREWAPDEATPGSYIRSYEMEMKRS